MSQPWILAGERSGLLTRIAISEAGRIPLALEPKPVASPASGVSASLAYLTGIFSLRRVKTASERDK